MAEYCTAGKATEENKEQLIACWIPKSTDILTVCNTDCLSTTAVVARMCLNVTL